MIKSALTACAALAAAGCTVEVSERDVPRIVNATVEARTSSPAYVAEMSTRSFSGRSASAVRYTLTKGLGAQYHYRFPGGFAYWTTEDGCVIYDRSTGRAEVFSGIAQPSDEAIRVSLDWTTRRWLRLNRVVASFSEREGEWRGFRVFSDPIKPRPLIRSTENFAERRTRAIVLSREFDGDGRLLIESRAESLRPIASGEYATPGLAHGARRDDFTLASLVEKTSDLPGWAAAPARILEVVAEPRSFIGNGYAAHDLSRGGFVMVAFRRPMPEDGSLISPVAKTFRLNGTDIHFWWIGANIFIRWRENGFEETIFTTVPIDYLYDYLVANVGARRSAGAR